MWGFVFFRSKTSLSGIDLTEHLECLFAWPQQTELEA